jgi:S-adenosylmethionine-diacylgycerolhomoserine-N-methlytransferase
MSAVADLPVLWRMLRGKPRHGTAAEQLDEFYGPQAASYDRFRERLLPGRREFMRTLPLSPGMAVLDLGAGTGGHWAHAWDSVAALDDLVLVDLCQPLLDVARARFAASQRVRCIHGDVEKFDADRRFDLVLFSFSLSMMSGWRAALDTATRHLAPGGRIAVIDFYTLDAAPPAPLAPVSALDRHFWPRWFRHDGVHLRPDVLPRLLSLGTTELLMQEKSPVPYMMGLEAAWFAWRGRIA